MHLRPFTDRAEILYELTLLTWRTGSAFSPQMNEDVCVKVFFTGYGHTLEEHLHKRRPAARSSCLPQGQELSIWSTYICENLFSWMSVGHSSGEWGDVAHLIMGGAIPHASLCVLLAYARFPEGFLNDKSVWGSGEAGFYHCLYAGLSLLILLSAVIMLLLARLWNWSLFMKKLQTKTISYSFLSSSENTDFSSNKIE